MTPAERLPDPAPARPSELPVEGRRATRAGMLPGRPGAHAVRQTHHAAGLRGYEPWAEAWPTSFGQG